MAAPLTGQPIIVVVGATGIGVIYHPDQFPRAGETVITDAMEIVPGGKASNVALGLARLGARVRLLSALGTDTWAAECRRIWDRAGIDSAGVTRIAGQATMTGSVIVGADAENVVIIGLGAMGAYGPDLVSAHAAAITGADICVVSLEMPTAAAARALEIARGADVTTILDPAPAPARLDAEKLLPLCDWVTPNAGEAVALGGSTDPATTARAILALGATNVAVTLGAAGALLVTGQTTTEIPVEPVSSVTDTSGAGDGFTAALAFALANGAGQAEAVRYGCAAARLIVQGPNFVGALPLWEDLPPLHSDMSLRS